MISTWDGDPGSKRMERLDFNTGWSYRHLKDGETYDRFMDMGGEEITLPHDAMLREKRSADSPGRHNTGYFTGRDYLYSRQFEIPESYREKHVLLEFEGVYHNAEVYLNGKKAAYRPNGYTQFYVEADSLLRYGGSNRIDVIARNADQPNSRWYSGAGIYRPVWMYVGGKTSLRPDRQRITTWETEPARMEFDLQAWSPCRVGLEIWDMEGCLIAKTEDETDGEGRVCISLTVPHARLWSVKSPTLYTYRIFAGEDVCEGSFGIRQVSWDCEKGLQINGRRVILRGACIHHDNGLLGACSFPEAEERKIRILKENGYNAIRSAHNPCSKALLDACDRLGMLVLDEYTDMWYIHKTRYDYASYLEQWWQQDLSDMVDKDYNHPSVIMYSIGNEVAETAQKKGILLTRRMTDFLHEQDKTRPVTCGINIFFNLLSSMGFGVYSDSKAAREAAKTAKAAKEKAVGSEFYNWLAGILGDTVMKLGATVHGCDRKTRDAFTGLDIAGYNYGIMRYRQDLKKYPERLILGTETFCRDAFLFYELAKQNPRIIGDFVWAGMDYLGETGIGAWEYGDYAPADAPRHGWLTAGSGRIDLTGKPLGEAAYAKVALGCETAPRMAVRPVHQSGRHSPSAWKMTNAMESWSFRGCTGKKAVVEVYTAADRAELFLNGKSMSRKKRKKDCRILFCIPYEDGELTAVVQDKDGREKGRCSLFTAGEETLLKILPETRWVRKGGLLYVRLQYTDGNGIVKPMERHRITLKVKGGLLLGCGSACPYNPEGYLQDTTDTYYGEALAIVRAEDADAVVITATDGRLTGEVAVPVEDTETR